MIEFQKAKVRLATLWFIMAGLFFSILFIQTSFGKFEDKVNDAWGWALPNVIPTLSLMLSIFLFDIKKIDEEIRSVSKFYFRLSFWASLFYLLLLISTLLLQPLTDYTIIELMKQSSIYLGPLQGLVSGSIGIFFFQKKK